MSSLPRKLFGRFLVKFLNSEQLRKVTEAFFSLDLQGDGVLCKKDILSACAAHAENQNSAFDTIWKYMCPEPLLSISLSRFSECMAEQVLDGRSLRHAFESLDDDGSECISPQELFDELRVFDDSLTLENVVAYVAEKDLNPHADGEENEVDKDCELHFNEFVQLFPERVKYVQTLHARKESTISQAAAYADALAEVKDDALEWVSDLEAKFNELHELTEELLNAKKVGFYVD